MIDVPTPDDSWTTVVVTIPPERAELAADVLWAAGAVAIEEQEDGAATVLLAGFPTVLEAEEAAARAEAAGHGPVTVRAVVDDGADAWRAHATPVQAGPYWLVPAWSEAPADAAPEAVLRLDPGRTFGSGSHPTTRLVVADLARLVRPGDRVLDVGCGSGVLAVAAVRSGAASVVGVDIDPASPEATRSNAAANGVAEQVTVDPRPLAEVVDDGPFDLVTANLLAPVIAELASDLVRSVAAHGHLVVSGLLADRWEASVPALAPLEVASVADEDGWVSVVLRRPLGHEDDRRP